jgi:hypothetical protein
MSNNNQDSRWQAEDLAAAEAKKQALLFEKERRQAEKAKGSLAEFVRAIWPIVEPSTPLEWSWHLDAFCIHLEAIFRNQIQNLAIMTPAGTTKTIVVMQAFPAWGWAQDAGLRYLCCANTNDLALQSSTQCREIVTSPWYQRHFPHVQITTDQDTKKWFGTTQRGFRKIGITKAKVTGQKADILLIDDPNDADEVESKVNRDAVINWYDRSCHDRVNNFKTSRRVVVAHRTHKDDLIGHCVRTHGYEPLIITEEFEPHRKYTTSIGWTDPRKEAGELLRSSRFGPEQVAAAKKQFIWRLKHQQDDAGGESSVFKPAYFKCRWRFSSQKHGWIVLDDGDSSYEFDAARSPMFASCDAAASADTSSDQTALGVFNVSPRGDLVWRHLYLKRLDIPDQPKLLAEARQDWPFSFIVIEAVGANRAMFQFAERMFLTAIPSHDNGEKLVKAQAAIIKASQGRIWLPEDLVNPDFDTVTAIDQLICFSGRKKGESNDIVDMLSMAVNSMHHVHQVGEGGEISVPVAVDSTQGARFCTPIGTQNRFGSMRPPTPTTVGNGNVQGAASQRLPWS